MDNKLQQNVKFEEDKQHEPSGHHQSAKDWNNKANEERRRLLGAGDHGNYTNILQKQNSKKSDKDGFEEIHHSEAYYTKLQFDNKIE